MRVKKLLASYTLHYTVGGSSPGSTSPELPAGLDITQPQTINMAAFMPSGIRGDVYSLRYQQQAYAGPVTVASSLAGLQCHLFKKAFRNIKGMQPLTPDSTYSVSNLLVPNSVKAPSFGIQFRGYLTVPEAGVYSFFYTCDDGSVLRIADRLVVDNDGNHFPIEKSGQVALSAGAHRFEANFIEGGGGFTINLKYSLNGAELRDIPHNWFTH